MFCLCHPEISFSPLTSLEQSAFKTCGNVCYRRILMLPFDSQSISLVMRLSHRASRVFKAFTDKEVMEVLSALVILGQHDEELLAAMEKHLPGVCGFIFPQPDFGETCLFGSKWTSILQALSNPQVLCCVCVCQDGWNKPIRR